MYSVAPTGPGCSPALAIGAAWSGPAGARDKADKKPGINAAPALMEPRPPVGSPGAYRRPAVDRRRRPAAARRHGRSHPRGSPALPSGAAGGFALGRKPGHARADLESGPHYLGARRYDSRTGRFLTRDPNVILTPSAYLYASGILLNRTDRSDLHDIEHKL